MAFLGIGIGAGLVSALLFGVAATGSPLGLLLCLVAPVPILIAALGWDHRTGLVAALVSGLFAALALGPINGIAFVTTSTLPAWWIAYLALLGRPVADGRIEWYPLGRLLLWVAAISAAATFAAILIIGRGGYEAYRTQMEAVVGAFLRAVMAASGTPGEQPATPSGEFVALVVAAIPAVTAAVSALVLLLNVWLAAKAVQISGRLPRPWPYIPGALMPRRTLLLVGAAVVLSLAPGLAGVAGLSLSGALGVAFALQGLAFLHQATRGRAARPVTLGIAYLLVLFAGHTVLPFFALLGAADLAFALRARFSPGPPGPNSPSP